MTEPTADRLADVLRRLRDLHPDWRFGQLVANVAMFARGPTDSAVWDVEDAEFVRAAEEHLKVNASAVEHLTA